MADPEIRIQRGKNCDPIAERYLLFFICVYSCAWSFISISERTRCQTEGQINGTPSKLLDGLHEVQSIHLSRERNPIVPGTGTTGLAEHRQLE